ncbi:MULTISPECIES: MBL fold metallo-hydrolase [Helcococcus]|uniref:MBL fold metallo-hydrolase n=1 Tax=Helcococcus bovis TaxID=3153252 RepID=A0ABW9F569_9FIRM
MKYKVLKNGNNPMNTNCYLIYSEETLDGYLIDAPSKIQKFIDIIEEKQLNIKYLLLTHGHFDHIEKVDFWRNKYNLKVVAYKYCEDYLTNPDLNLSSVFGNSLTASADIYLSEERGSIDIFKYIYTPGHSYDSVIYILDNLVFCGDLIFLESVGRTDFKGSNHNDLVASIQNIIYEMDDENILLPGHGDNTKVGHEKKYNPFVACK